MLMKKRILLSMLAIGMASLSLPSLAAADLLIVNNTKLSSTSKINDGDCTSKLGSIGITKPNSKNTLPSALVLGACAKNLKSCKAEVFMTEKCGTSSEVIATVYINATDSKINSINVANSLYRITGKDAVNGKGFYLQLDGGPSA